MDSYQSIKRVFTLGARYPQQVARLRVGIGIWLLALTGILYGTGHAGRWGWLLVPTAALHPRARGPSVTPSRTSRAASDLECFC